MRGGGLIRREAWHGGKLENLKEKNYTQRFLTLYFSLLEEFCGRCDVLNFDRSWVPLLMNIIN